MQNGSIFVPEADKYDTIFYFIGGNDLRENCGSRPSSASADKVASLISQKVDITLQLKFLSSKQTQAYQPNLSLLSKILTATKLTDAAQSNVSLQRVQSLRSSVIEASPIEVLQLFILTSVIASN